MTESLRDNFGLCTTQKHEAGECMAEVVESSTLQAYATSNTGEGVREVASSHDLTSEELKARFFDDLANYDDLLSFEKKKEELEGEVTRLESEIESLQKATSRLGVPRNEVEEAVRSLTSLKKRGITPSTIASYYRVLYQAEISPDELEREVLEFGGIRKAIKACTEALKRLKEKEEHRTKAVEALRSEETSKKQVSTNLPGVEAESDRRESREGSDRRGTGNTEDGKGDKRMG